MRLTPRIKHRVAIFTPINVGTADHSIQCLLAYTFGGTLTTTGPTNGIGGTLLFPSTGTYIFDGTLTIDLSNSQTAASLIFMGSGEGTLATPLLKKTTTAGDLFVINNGTHPDANIGGIVFQDLQIAYDTSLSTGAAIRVSNDSSGTGSQNVRMFRMTFHECPQGVVFQNTLQGLVEQCTFEYDAQTAGAAITVDMAQTPPSPLPNVACNEILIKKCDIRSGAGDTNTTVGIAVYACIHVSVENTSISGVNEGIVLNPSSTASSNIELVTILDCNVGTWSAGLQLLPQNSAGSFLREVRVASSSFTQSTGGTYAAGGIFMNLPLGGANSQVETIKLIGVTSQGWKGPGLQILGGRNIQIVGGTYAGNGPSYAGIAIGSTPANISIVGADLGAKYSEDLTAQGTALSVAGSPNTILCKSCTMVGYSGVPITVSGTPSNLQVVECAGYNDKGILITGSAPTLNTALTIGQLGSTPYYGPGECYVLNAGNGPHYVLINGNPTYLTTGSFYLQPLETIEIDSSVGKFVAIGK